MSYSGKSKYAHSKLTNVLSKQSSKPGTIRKQHHDRSIQYLNTDNFSVDQSHEHDTIITDDALPPLLDLSLQSITDFDHVLSRSSEYNTDRTYKTKQDRKTEKHTQSLYIYEDSDYPTSQFKANNMSNQDTQSGQNYSLDRHRESQAQFPHNICNRRTYPPPRYDSIIAQQEIELEYTPILHSIGTKQALTEPSTLDKFEKYNVQSSYKISPMAQFALQIYNKFMHENQPRPNNPPQSQKSTRQILASLFINPLKAQKYINHLLQASIRLEKKSIENKRVKQQSNQQKESKSLRREVNLNHQKDIQVCKLLGCLLAKIRESSLRSGQNIPQITNKNGQINFNFGSSKATNSPMMESGRSAVSSKRSPQKTKKVSNFQENKKRMKELQQKSNQQDALIQQIKQEYESIVNNYAHTIMNLAGQGKHSHLHNDTFSQGPAGRRKNHIKIEHESSQQSQEDQADRELRLLIENSKRINTAEVFNRLSQQSKKKVHRSKNIH